jgi:cellulose synthase/poly-beta-1,6-N-acetylglucosamine synthase-like glycosyltransferase
MIMELLFIFSVAALYYIYDGYLRLLQILNLAFKSTGKPKPIVNKELPSVTVLLTVFNEAGAIVERLHNILGSDYPPQLLDVLVASDGSTDETDDLVRQLDEKQVRLFRPSIREGKTSTQNQAIPLARGEIIVFTDAGTRFDKNFIKKVVSPFQDPAVGAVDGHLLLISDPESGVSQNQGRYWGFELRLRALESQLGILAVASGACLAVRRELLKPMCIAYGEDCMVPLDVASQGYRVVHATDALATDLLDTDPDREFRTRVRMTLRNWQGTWSRRGLLNPVHYPGYALALWSHKMLRWMSPLFLILMLVSATVLALEGNSVFQAWVSLLVILCIGGLIGRQGENRRLSLPGTSAVYSFLLANAGFFVGLWKCLFGHKVTIYRHETLGSGTDLSQN